MKTKKRKIEFGVDRTYRKSGKENRKRCFQGEYEKHNKGEGNYKRFMFGGEPKEPDNN